MNDELITFYRQYLNNGTTITFDYKGINNNMDIDKYYDLLHKVFNNYSPNIFNLIRDIRTVLKGFKEEYLDVYLINNYSEIHVLYVSGKLHIYEEDNYLNNNKVSFKYEINKNINYNINGDLNINFDFNKFMDTLMKLQNISAISIDYKEELLFKVYKLFYDKNPDFCDKSINIEIQNMISILNQFNICLNYPLSVNSTGRMPQNINLTSLIRDFRALGIVDVDNLTSIKLTYPYEKEIKEIGKIIRDSKIDMLTLSKIIYASNYSLNDNYNLNNITEFTNCSKNEIDNSVKLIKKINSQLK